MGVRDILQFSNLAGVIDEEDKLRFERTLFRMTRGNTYTHFQPIPDPLYDQASGKHVLKTVFVVYFQGGINTAMRNKVHKICVAFGAYLCNWPSGIEKARAALGRIESTVVEQKKALAGYERFVAEEVMDLCKLVTPDGNSMLEEWRMFCLKEKGIYAVLNMFEGQATLRAHSFLLVFVVLFVVSGWVYIV